jgi:uncharacterized protein
MPIEMVVKGLALDPLIRSPIVILKDKDEKKILPIWIGIFEANAIALELEKISTPRPMTHDLILNVMTGLRAKIQKIEINELKDSTYFANIHLVVASDKIIIDARPSDAIAIALRADAPIFVSKEVVEKTQSFDIDFKLDSSERMKDWLESLEPEDFGKYKM